MIMQELGFSSDAAEMQLTAIYKTPSPQDDPFIELDFHLLDIEIDELILESMLLFDHQKCHF